MTNSRFEDMDSLWDYDQPNKTEARFRAIVPSVESQPAHYAELLTQIARAQGLQRNFEEAHATLAEIESLLDHGGLRLRVRYLLESGRVLNSSGHPDRARPYFEEVLSLAASDPAVEFYAVDAAHMLAIITPGEEALVFNLRALTMIEASADPRVRGWKGSLLNNIGWTCHAAGDYTSALDYLQRGLDFRREQGQAEETRIARWCVARVRRDLGQVSEALMEQQSLLAEYDAIGQASGYVFEEIGECFLLIGKEMQARPWFAKA
jgi:tetratricopeptide (TPR) repeat protein